jgi:DNA polymerase III, gamma/tau subunits
MIIWQPEFMHPSAANGILKILEEPPVNTFFILVSNAAERLMPTILSRTQMVQVPLLADEELETFLRANKITDESQLQEILQIAEGNVNLALKLKEQEENHHFDLFFNWMLACYGRKYPELVGLADEFHNFDKLNQRNLLSYSLSMLHETLLQNSAAQQLNRSKGNELERVQRFSKIMDVRKIDFASRLINDATYHLERNGSAKMIFLDLSLQLSKMFSSQS